MAGEDQTRRGPLLIRGVNPADGKSYDIQIGHRRLLLMAKLGPWALQEAAELVPYAVQKPTAIFEGLRREADEDGRGYGWRCYVTVPDRAFRKDGSKTTPWPRQVFLVFVNEDRIAYNWRWEECDPSDSQLPQGHTERFRKRLL